MNTPEDKIERLIANEARQKKVAIQSVIIFIIAVIAIVALSFWNVTLQLKNRQVAGENIQLTIDGKRYRLVADSLKNSLALKDSILEAIKNQPNVSAVLKNKVEQLQLNMQEADAKVLYTVFIQYSDGMDQKQDQLNKALKELGIYKVPSSEWMRKQKFSSSVRYFDKADSLQAVQLADDARKSCGVIFPVQYTAIKAPSKQLEVWIGNVNPLK